MQTISDPVDEVIADWEVKMCSGFRVLVDGIKDRSVTADALIIPTSKRRVECSVILIQTNGLSQGHLSIEIKHENAGI